MELVRVRIVRDARWGPLNSARGRANLSVCGGGVRERRTAGILVVSSAWVEFAGGFVGGAACFVAGGFEEDKLAFAAFFFSVSPSSCWCGWLFLQICAGELIV